MSESTSASILKFSPEAQAWVDALIDAVATVPDPFVDEHPALEPLENWLEHEDRLYLILNEMSFRVHIPRAYQVIQTACEGFQGKETDEAAFAAVLDTLRTALDGKEEFWGFEYTIRIAFPLYHSNGKDSAVICFEWWHESEPVSWKGLYPSRAAYEASFKIPEYLGRIDHALLLREPILRGWHSSARRYELLLTRDEARAIRLPYYHGQRCTYWHRGLRRTSDDACVTCAEIDQERRSFQGQRSATSVDEVLPGQIGWWRSIAGVGVVVWCMECGQKPLPGAGKPASHRSCRPLLVDEVRPHPQHCHACRTRILDGILDSIPDRYHRAHSEPSQ